MSGLLVGFDSAWTVANLGALAGVLVHEDGRFEELGIPMNLNYREAERVILQWQSEKLPTSTLILVDQPTIVQNATGQRPVESIVCSAVSLRYGGMQPANTGRIEMFGTQAPIWSFLARFGGASDPLANRTTTQVLETYPVLAMISLGWMLPDKRSSGRLPKYNPDRRRKFALADWEHVCRRAHFEYSSCGLTQIAQWIDRQAKNPSPRKADQDCLDACICLLVALHLAERRDCLIVGNGESGYIVVPDSAVLRTELEARCSAVGWLPRDWVRVFRLDE